MTTSSTPSNAELVLQSVENGVATIVLNRPEKFNSFIRPMAEQLLAALVHASSTPTIRAIVLAANGRAFCAGQDLSEVTPEAGKQLDLGAIVAGLYNPIIRAIVEAPKPVIAAVSGVAAGAGANLALACDFVVAAESASFIQAFSKVGLIPDSGGTYFLPRLLGLARAKALTMLGEKISAKDMKEWGAIYQVVPDAELMSHAQRLAATLASGPTHALGLTKQMLNCSLGNSFSAQLKLEEDGQRSCGLSEDYRTGIEAFINKKSPTFSGR